MALLLTLSAPERTDVHKACCSADMAFVRVRDLSKRWPWHIGRWPHIGARSGRRLVESRVPQGRSFKVFSDHPIGQEEIFWISLCPNDFPINIINTFLYIIAFHTIPLPCLQGRQKTWWTQSFCLASQGVQWWIHLWADPKNIIPNSSQLS